MKGGLRRTDVCCDAKSWRILKQTDVQCYANVCVQFQMHLGRSIDMCFVRQVSEKDCDKASCIDGIPCGYRSL